MGKITVDNKLKGIVSISLKNKPVNAIDISIIKELDKVIDSINISSNKLIIFETSIDHFSAGADLKERENFTEKQTIDFLDQLNNLYNKIYNLNCITISSIKGACLGGGLELVLSTDFRIASKSSILGFPETSIGIIPGAGGTQRLTRIAGIQTATKWIFTSEKYSSDMALDDGVVDFVVDDKNLSEFSLNFARKINLNAPIALVEAKKSINSAFIDQGFLQERKSYLRTLKSEDRNEGLQSFKEKRPPNWNNS